MIALKINRDWTEIKNVDSESVFCAVVEKNDIVQITTSIENEQITSNEDVCVYLKRFEKEVIKTTASQKIFVRTMRSEGILTISSDVFK